MMQWLTKLSKLFSGGGLLSLSIQLAGFGLAFILSIVISNLYGDKAYGDYVLVFSTIDILALFAMVGYHQLFARFIPQWTNDQKKRAALFSVGNKRTFRNACFFALLLLLFAWFYKFEDQTVQFFVIGAALCLPILALANLQTTFLYSLSYNVWPQINEKIIKSVVFLLVILTLFVVKFDPNNLLWAFVISSVFSFIIVNRLKKNQFPKLKLKEVYDFSDTRKSIFLLVLISLITMIFSKTDTYMVAYYLGAEYSGVNNVYMKITSVMILAMTGLIVSSSPIISEQLSKQKLDLVRKEVKKIARFSFMAAVFLLGGIAVFSPWFFSLYDSSLFTENSDTMYIYGFSNFVNLFTGPASVILMLSNKLKHLIYGYIIELVLNLSLNTLLIPIFELKGAAMATFISEGAINIYFAYICYKVLRVNTLLIGK